eukprot:scaffold1462_cov168-Ochromonas_danica.AAC.9
MNSTATLEHHDPSSVVDMVDKSSAIEDEEDEESHILETHSLLQEPVSNSLNSSKIISNNTMLPLHSPNYYLHCHHHNGDGDGDVVPRYRGFDRTVWQGLYIGCLTFFVLNSTLIYLVVDFASYPIFRTIPWIVNLALILPVFLLARVGLRETKTQTQGSVEESLLSQQQDKWELLQLVIMSSLVFMGWLWGIQSFYQQLLFEEPVCDDLSFDTIHSGGGSATTASLSSSSSTSDNSLSLLPSSTAVTLEPACDWAYRSVYFQIHAIAGPAVLITATFNFMKFSRGLVFAMRSHVWIGRLHNILLMVSALGGIFMGIMSEHANWLDRLESIWAVIVLGKIDDEEAFLLEW